MLYKPTCGFGNEEFKAHPYERESSAALVIGRYMVMFGGFSNSRRELGDFWVGNLSDYFLNCYAD